MHNSTESKLIYSGRKVFSAGWEQKEFIKRALCGPFVLKTSSVRLTDMTSQETWSVVDVDMKTLDQFELGREIGKGQFSVVHRATFQPDQLPVALKRVQLLEMVDSKARTDCMKEIQLLKVLF